MVAVMEATELRAEGWEDGGNLQLRNHFSQGETDTEREQQADEETPSRKTEPRAKASNANTRQLSHDIREELLNILFKEYEAKSVPNPKVTFPTTRFLRETLIPNVP